MPQVGFVPVIAHFCTKLPAYFPAVDRKDGLVHRRVSAVHGVISNSLKPESQAKLSYLHIKSTPKKRQCIAVLSVLKEYSEAPVPLTQRDEHNKGIAWKKSHLTWTGTKI